MQLTNLKIVRLTKGKSGTNKYGDWQAYNLFFDNEKWKGIKFDYFGRPKKVIPVEGMEIASIEFEKKQEDGFTNYLISKIVPNEIGPEPEPEPVPDQATNTTRSGNGQSPVSMYVSYAKDMAVAKIAVASKDSTILKTGLIELAQMVAQAGREMREIAEAKRETSPIQEEPEGPKTEQKDEEKSVTKSYVDIGQDDIPF